METYLLEWGNLLLRWLHVIAAIAWIGSSFYFVFLDKNLLPPIAPDLKKKGVDGAMWAVHGGGFYHPQKYMVAPKTIDSKLHWFYWESYVTWLSGFGLFVVLYLWNAEFTLVDKSLMDWSGMVAGIAAVASLVVFWFIYDSICRIWGEKPKGEYTIAILVIIIACIATWLLTQLFSGRAAFLITGAMLATTMSANVLFCIIPGQRKAWAQMQAGEPVNPIYGRRGKQRSVHNTYFTLPVIIAMLSNHYGFLYTHSYNWLVLILLMAAGVLIRQFFVQRHDWHNGRAGNPWPWAVGGIAFILALVIWLVPASALHQSTASSSVDQAIQTVTYAELKPVLEQHCYSCHGAQLQMKNLRVDNLASVQQHAASIYQNVVVNKTMPMSNASGMTQEERDMVARWFQGFQASIPQ